MSCLSHTNDLPSSSSWCAFVLSGCKESQFHSLPFRQALASMYENRCGLFSIMHHAFCNSHTAYDAILMFVFDSIFRWTWRIAVLSCATKSVLIQVKRMQRISWGIKIVVASFQDWLELKTRLCSLRKVSPQCSAPVLYKIKCMFSNPFLPAQSKYNV